MNENFELPPKETEYMEYLSTPKTTVEIMEHFHAKENACWQMLRTLRLKRLVIHDNESRRWRTVDEHETVEICFTPYQHEVLKYLKSSHRTTEVMETFCKSYQSAFQVIRTLCLMGAVESTGRGSSSGHGGTWKMWKATDKGVQALEMMKNEH